VSRYKALLWVWALVCTWSGAPYLRAALDPPEGRVFVGTFHWIDDFYNYAQYLQQAEDGHVLFRNKLLSPREARPELLNLEWLALGRVSLALGRRPLLAYRVLAVIAALVLLAGIERWLERLGVNGPHRLPALVMIAFGGGLGGLLFEWTDATVAECVDLSVGLFPFLQLLANPHFALGSALFVWALWCFAEVPAPRGPLTGIALATLLGLVRPYDLALLGLVRGLAVISSERPAAWARAMLPLLGLLPVLAYDLWVFFGSNQFAPFRKGSSFPTLLECAAALGPVSVLALLSRGNAEPASRRARVHVWTWAAIAAAAILLRPPAFSLQFLVGAGIPLLLLGASWLRRFSPRWTLLAALPLSTSAVVATRIVLADDPNWFVPRERMAAALALRPGCTEADRLLAPPDVGLYAIGLTACHAYLAHPSAPDYAAHLADARAFYTGMPGPDRQALLDRNEITRLVLPGFAGPRPVSWLGPRTDFEAVAIVGSGDGLTSIYARKGKGLITP
jgi:hypothetical protein